MKVVKIGELKNRLSHYLREVRRGQSLLVADRDRVIARIDRVVEDSGVADEDVEWIDGLERKGVLRRPRSRLPKGWVDQRVKVSADLVATVIDERAEGR